MGVRACRGEGLPVEIVTAAIADLRRHRGVIGRIHPQCHHRAGLADALVPGHHFPMVVLVTFIAGQGDIVRTRDSQPGQGGGGGLRAVGRPEIEVVGGGFRQRGPAERDVVLVDDGAVGGSHQAEIGERVKETRVADGLEVDRDGKDAHHPVTADGTHLGHIVAVQGEARQHAGGVVHGHRGGCTSLFPIHDHPRSFTPRRMPSQVGVAGGDVIDCQTDHGGTGTLVLRL